MLTVTNHVQIQTRALPAYLVDSIGLRYNLEGEDTHLEARPILFEVGGAYRLTERAIWSLIVDQSTGADDVCAYIDGVITHTGCNEDLGFYSNVRVVGQDALFAYIDRYLDEKREGDMLVPDQFERTVGAFLRFLRKCDMDHEVYQDAYISKLLGTIDKNQAVDLLVFRLTNGQHRDLTEDKRPYIQAQRDVKGRA